MSQEESRTPVLLYVFSGPHMGAVLELESGQWLLGSDDSCDLIMKGLAPRHALLKIEQEGDEQRVSLAPLDGAVRLQDDENDRVADPDREEEALELEAGEAWYLGRTCFAWNLKGVEQPDIQPVQGGVRAAAEPEVPADNEVAPSASDTAEESGNNVADTADVNGAITELPEEKEVTPEEKQRRKVKWRFRALVLLIILLGGMSFALTPKTPDSQQKQAVVQKYLEDAGLKGLQITERDPGIEVRGAVDDDKAMLTLRDMARALQFPVYLEVGVREDIVRAVHSSLGIRGYHPEVRIVDEDGKSCLRVAAYMKDKMLERAAFAALSGEVRGLPATRRHIMHENDVAPVLERALADAGFSSVKVLYLPGRVDFSGDFHPEDLPVLMELRQQVSEKLGVPLDGSATAALAEVLPQAGMNALAAEAALDDVSGSDPLGGLRVTGVTMSPMRFVTTSDGRRLFEGARLPGGCTLDSISTSTLTLRRGENVFTYRLRGPQ